MKIQPRSLSVGLPVALIVTFLSAAVMSSCSSRPSRLQENPIGNALFEEGMRLFYKAVADEVNLHPERSRLNAREAEKISNLQKVYPRLYGILVNYYYQKDEPTFRALLEEGTDESKARFRTMYLDLSRFSAHMFVECLFQPSSHGAYFRGLIPRFKGKDTVDIVALSTGNMANLNLPTKIVPKTLSPEFERQWGLDAARFRAAHQLTKGAGARIGIIDSGIDVSHPVFKNTRWGTHFNFVGRDGLPWSPAGPPMVDWGWHGTVVTSIVARYAPEAQITLYREIDADTQNDSPFPLILTSLMGAAIYRAVHDGNDVINISAGSDLDTDYLREACKYAYDHNVMVVTASPYYIGRYLGENENYPGQYTTTVSVTGIEKRGENKYGPWDVAAPEVTTTVGSPDAPFVAFPTYVDEKDDYAPGISCATPIVASLLALVESVYPRLGTEQPGEYFETVKRLLTENANPKAVGFEGFSPECGYGLIDAEKTVRAASELQRERLTRAKRADEKRGFEKSAAFRVAKFPEAIRITRGKGVKLAVIDPGRNFEKEAPDLSSVVSACAPEAEIRIYAISPGPNALHEYLPADQLARAISRAAEEKNDIILTTLLFPSDFPFLKRVCQSAHEKNIIIIAPGNPFAPENPEQPAAFPSHYSSALAVAGVVWDKQNNLIPWDAAASSHYVSVAAPAAAERNAVPSQALSAAMTAGLAALVSSTLPKTGRELPGQYVERIREILAKSANPQILGYKSFNSKIGYGLIDAQKTVGEGVPAYRKKMKQIEDDFKKRMDRRAKDQEEAATKKPTEEKK